MSFEGLNSIVYCELLGTGWSTGGCNWQHIKTLWCCRSCLDCTRRKSETVSFGPPNLGTHTWRTYFFPLWRLTSTREFYQRKSRAMSVSLLPLWFFLVWVCFVYILLGSSISEWWEWPPTYIQESSVVGKEWDVIVEHLSNVLTSFRWSPEYVWQSCSLFWSL